MDKNVGAAEAMEGCLSFKINDKNASELSLTIFLLVCTCLGSPREKEMYSERLFRRPNNDFGERFFAFKPLIYQKMDLGKIDAREA